MTSGRTILAADSSGHHRTHNVQHATRVAAQSHSGTADPSAPYVGAFLIVGFVVLVLVIIRNALKGGKKRQGDAITEPSAIVLEWLDRINRGALPEIHPVGIVPVAGERFFYQQRAQYGQTYPQRVYAGGNRALYIPLGHGFRARVGGNSGHAQTVTNFMWRSYGTVFVSNVRVAFKGDGSPEIAMAAYDRILGYDTHPDGLAIQVDGVGMMQFRTGDVILGALFQNTIQRRSQPPAADAASPEV
jgi:hypothetical protein